MNSLDIQPRNPETLPLKKFERSWVQYFGLPNVIRCDLEGSFRGYNFSLWSQERGVEMSVCPAEDHGQIGEVESLIGKIKEDVRTYLRDRDVDPFLGVLHMINAHNSLDRVGGYAPCQWAHGRMPAIDGRLLSGGNDVPFLASQGTPNTDFRLRLQVRVAAEEHYRKSQAAQ